MSRSSQLKQIVKESLKQRRNTYVDKVLSKRCAECKDSIRPPQAYHCQVCGRCIAYMDHHCPWVNNCVGLYTQKPFILFLFYSILALLTALIINVNSTLNALSQISGAVALDFEFTMRFLVIIESVPFMMFLSVVLFDQLVIVLNRPSTLQRIRDHEQSYREEKIERNGKLNFQVTFGESKFSYRWLLPRVIEGKFDMEELYS
ncbi:hypothetical protein FGO68_gene4645 [Halteria grandinella]|uniref:Palmitoyltransferase n=1 Tax=Halteria grandinella TaxID=5974 RepID=A0A8J8NQF8_HALGN|nr:hypothetical protein FGO68_gene4645 [Halteria grandinella]